MKERLSKMSNTAKLSDKASAILMLIAEDDMQEKIHDALISIVLKGA